MRLRDRYFRPSEILHFPNRPYKTISGENSTLHEILLKPSKRDTTGGKGKDAPPRWTAHDKANLVKIFDDPSIDVATKTVIAAAFAIHPQEIAEYRRKLHTLGLSALRESAERPQDPEEPLWIKHGSIELNPKTRDIRCRGNYELLEERELRVLTLFLRRPNSVIPTDRLRGREPTGALRALLSYLDKKLFLLTGKRHIKNEYDQGYIFSLSGFDDR